METETRYDIPNAYVLAGMADCASPDSPTSDGATFLIHTARDLVERLTYCGGLSDRDSTGDGTDVSDLVSEVADGAPDIYTHTRWKEFVDLCAYQEDPTEYGADGSDMTQTAGVCLYIIAERLCWALVEDMLSEDDTE